MRWFVESDFELLRKEFMDEYTQLIHAITLLGLTDSEARNVTWELPYNMKVELGREYNRRTSGHSQTDS